MCLHLIHPYSLPSNSSPILHTLFLSKLMCSVFFIIILHPLSPFSASCVCMGIGLSNGACVASS